jgi:hypothetical protein
LDRYRQLRKGNVLSIERCMSVSAKQQNTKEFPNFGEFVWKKNGKE